MSLPISHLEWIFETGEKSFRPMPEWCAQLRKDGLRCPHCDAIRQDAKSQVTQLVLESVPPDKYVGMILLGGLVLRSELIALIGAEKLQQLCFSVPVVDRNGIFRQNLRFFMERNPRAKWRGNAESKIGLCKECGRLLYWPAGEAYLLRRYWNVDDDITVLDSQLLCVPGYFDRVLAPQHFPLLTTESRVLADDPQDGLPADYDEMIAGIRRRGWTR